MKNSKRLESEVGKLLKALTILNKEELKELDKIKDLEKQEKSFFNRLKRFKISGKHVLSKKDISTLSSIQKKEDDLKEQDQKEKKISSEKDADTGSKNISSSEKYEKQDKEKKEVTEKEIKDKEVTEKEKQNSQDDQDQDNKERSSKKESQDSGKDKKSYSKDDSSKEMTLKERKRLYKDLTKKKEKENKVLSKVDKFLKRWKR